MLDLMGSEMEVSVTRRRTPPSHKTLASTGYARQPRSKVGRFAQYLLGGSWVLRSGVTSMVSILITGYNLIWGTYNPTYKYP